MTVRLFVEPVAIANGKAYVEGDAGHYLTRVMRMGVGDALVLLDGSGMQHEARITSTGKDRVVAEVVSSTPVPPPAVAITLYQALPKADKLDLILQKATELGVTRVVPLAAKRSVVQVSHDKVAAKLERWRKIATEAAEQSERGEVPTIDAPLDLDEVKLTQGTWGLVLSERSRGLSLLQSLPLLPPAEIALFVGPEGGWTPEELATLEAAGAKSVSMGCRILRAETAAIAAIALVMGRYELG